MPVLDDCEPGLRALAQAWRGGAAEDALREILIRARAESSPARIFAIAADVLRERGPGVLTSPPDGDEAPAPDDALDRSDDLSRVARAVEDLDPLYRAPFLLRLRHGFTPARIAELLDLSVERVRALLRGAILEIRTNVRSGA